MKKYKLIKVISLCLVMVLTMCLFSACAGNKNNSEQADAPSDKIENDRYLEESPLAPKEYTSRIEPDVDKAKVKEASKKQYTAKTEEEFVQALINFANPNGNEYDAFAVLGDFNYNEKGEELLSRFKAASADWHAVVVEKVGDKCVVDIELKGKTPIDKSDAKVTDWSAINGIDCESFSNIKCTIFTNYSKDSVTLSLDIVKVDGNWHFASISSIDKVLNAITTYIYK